MRLVVILCLLLPFDVGGWVCLPIDLCSVFHNLGIGLIPVDDPVGRHDDDDFLPICGLLPFDGVLMEVILYYPLLLHFQSVYSMLLQSVSIEQ